MTERMLDLSKTVRLHYRVGMINKDDFELLKGKLKVLLEVTP